MNVRISLRRLHIERDAGLGQAVSYERVNFDPYLEIEPHSESCMPTHDCTCIYASGCITRFDEGSLVLSVLRSGGVCALASVSHIQIRQSAEKGTLDINLGFHLM